MIIREFGWRAHINDAVKPGFLEQSKIKRNTGDWCRHLLRRSTVLNDA
jgi:hypothetical protein